MLYFVGLGISGCRSIPAEAARLISDAPAVYLEQFTSPVDGADVARLEDMSGGRLCIARRWQVEDGTEILQNAKKHDTVLLTYGDPYVATTHVELRTRAQQEGIATRTIHASSILTSIMGECGLHLYKMGRTATIMADSNSLTTPYYTLYRNMIEGSHTVLLLEYDESRNFFLDPRAALDGLMNAERGQGRNVLSGSTFGIVASRIGLDDQGIVSGNVSDLLEAGFGGPPHSIIIPGRLHFTEANALRMQGSCLEDPHDNTIEKISCQMLKKYVPMVREALEQERQHYTGTKFDSVLENAELYMRDAEKFLDDGQDEVAILSIGYADGLVDAMRIARGMDPKM